MSGLVSIAISVILAAAASAASLANDVPPLAPPVPPDAASPVDPSPESVFEKAHQLYQKGDNVGAAATVRTIFSTWEKKYGATNARLVPYMLQAAELFEMLNRLPEAEALFQRALSIRESSLTSSTGSSLEVASVLYNLAWFYSNLANHPKSEELFKRCIAIRERIVGRRHILTASALNGLAVLYENMGDYAKSEQLFLESLDIKQALAGPESLTAATTMNNLATLYMSQNDYRLAERFLTQALAIRERTRGPNATGTITSVNNLALLYRSMGDFVRAKALFERVLRARQTSLGANHSLTITTLGHLGLLEGDLGNDVAAEALLKRVAEARQRIYKEDHPDTARGLFHLALLYDRTNRLDLALPLHLKALEMRRKVLGKNHPETAASLSFLARHYHMAGDTTKALPLYEEALALQKKLLGMCHPETLETLDSLAYLNLDIGNKERAQQLCRESMATREQMLRNLFAFASEDQRVLFQKALSLYSLPASLGCPQDIARALARTKGVVLDSIMEQREALRQSTNKDTRNLMTQMRQIRRDLAESIRRRDNPEPTGGGNDSDEARRLLPLPSPEELQLKQDRLYADLGERLNSGAESWQALRTDPAKIAEALPAGAVLVDFVEYQAYTPNLGRPVPSYGAVVITHDAAPQWITLGPADPLDAEVRAVQELARKRVRDIYVATALQALQRRLWAPLEKAIPAGTSRVIISPDGEINFVSFPTLLDGEQRFLADRFTFEHVATARDVLTASALSAQPVTTPRLLVLAYPDYSARLEGGSSGSGGAAPNPGTGPVKSKGSVPAASPLGAAPSSAASPTIPISLPFRSTPASAGQTQPQPGAGAMKPQAVSAMPGGATLPVQSGGGGSTPAMPNVRGLSPALAEWMEESLKPLSGTLREAEYLRDSAPRWGMRADVRTGAEATEASLHQGSPPYILHMATHGLFLPDPSAASPVAAQLPSSPGQPIAAGALNRTRALSPQATAPPGIQPRNPMQRSLLALAGAGYGFDSWQRGGPVIGENDGILTAQELAELNLRGTWLVVLSACDTGIGMAQGGEGVLGLRRGFHLAGARYLLVTLWPVPDDDTVDFIEAFYDEALKTKNPPVALADVQRKLLKKLREERGLLEAVRSAGGFMLSY